MIDAETLRAMLDYDLETGVFRWRVTLSNRAPAGTIAGARNGGGYMQIRVWGCIRAAHRLAWLYVHGVWPPEDVDHINRVRHDNRLANLRLASRSENLMNAKKRKGTGTTLKGVTFRGGRYIARIRVRREEKHLGCFATEQEAHGAYCAAAIKEFGAYHHAG